MQRLCRALIGEGLIRSAHDCSEGGLAVALAEACIAGRIGFNGQPVALERLIRAAEGRADLALFGEGQSRIVVSCAPPRLAELLARAAAIEVEALVLGTAGGTAVRWGENNLLDGDVEQLGEAWNYGFERLFD